MIIDRENLFSNEQTVSASVQATNIVDCGKGAINGSLIRLFVTGSNGSGSGTIAITLSSCDTQNGSYVTHYTSGGIAGTTIGAGYQLLSMPLPADCKRFVKVSYTVSGTASAKLTAGLVFDTEANY